MLIVANGASSKFNFEVRQRPSGPMTTKSILKHPYWLPPEGGKGSPNYQKFSIQAMKAFTKWREEAYDFGEISHNEYMKFLNGRVQDMPG